MPEVHPRPRLLVRVVWINEPCTFHARPAVDVHVRAARLDREVAGHLGVLRQWEWRAIDRNRRDTQLTHDLPVLAANHRPDGEVQLQPWYERCRDDGLLCRRRGDGDRMRGV